MDRSTLHLPACCTPIEPGEQAALDGGCHGHGHGCGGRRHHTRQAGQTPACPWQHSHRDLCALGIDCPFYVPGSMIPVRPLSPGEGFFWALH